MKMRRGFFMVLAGLILALAFSAWPESTPTADPCLVRAIVKTRYKKKRPRIDRSPARRQLEGRREAPLTVELPVDQPPWTERMKALGIGQKAPRSLRIGKQSHRLELIAGGKVVGTFPVGLGRNPINDKLQEGDRATPEGRFRIVAKHPSASHLSLCLDYPNAASREKIERARRLGIPLTKGPGGDICIHGHGVWGGKTFYKEDGSPVVLNWTRGCVTLNDEMMDEVYEFARLGDEVEIVW
ncbi:MAG: L,D-transpeptidase [Myxococcales bacterium]|nr:L,D-transpeptidase [Myxococcales bacterium]